MIKTLTSRVVSRVVAPIAVALLGVAVSLQANAADLTAPKQTERRLLGQAIDRPLAASADPQVMNTLAELRGKAQTNGKVRVIVGVRAAFAPEGNLSSVEAQAQRDETANVQRVMRAKLPKHAADQITDFEFIPFSALSVDADELETLAGMAEVTDIQEDRLGKPTLMESVPLIRANLAWAAGYIGSGWAVAVLDTGVDKTHPFLTGAVVSEACYSSTSAINGSTSMCPGGVSASTAVGSGVNCSLSIQGCKHGTHVAGIAAGLGSSSGVAKGANIIAIQVFSRVSNVTTCGSSNPCTSVFTSDLLSGLNRVYALRGAFNIAAVNLSLGFLPFNSQSACDASQGSVKAVVDLLRSVNIATVIASGNDGLINGADWPGCISSAVTVGATFDAAGYPNNGLGWNGGNSSVDEVAYFSDSASFLDLLAPGADIISSVPGGNFESMWGTSQATPHVAGCWAILKQAKPTATVDQIEQALKNTGVPVQDWRSGLIKPRIDCKGALDSLLGSGGSFPNLTISAFSASPITVMTGGIVNLAATVRNAGAGSSGTTTLRYYEWLGSWSEVSFCRDSVGVLAPGATSNQSCLIVPPTTPGTYYYDVAVDTVFGESNTSDNSFPYVTVTVTPTSIPSYLLSVTKTGTGGGTVTATGINCGGDCSETFPSGTLVTLTATPSAGSTFTGWSGACAGGSCQVTINAATSVTANFNLIPSNLTISAFTASPLNVSVGGIVDLAATVRNAGAGSSSATTLRYYEWLGSAWSEMTFCRTSIVGLAPGAISNQSCAIIPPSTLGPYYYGVDVDLVPGESNTGDNWFPYLTITVSIGGTCGGNAATNSALVEQYYAAILRRPSDAGGKAFWTSEADRLCGLGADPKQTFVVMANVFFNTPEYLAFNRDDNGYVTDLYNAFFSRLPDPAGLSYWLGQLASGMPRNNVMSSFLFSPEFTATMNTAFPGQTARAETYLVLNLYGGLFRRLAESGGFTYWTGQVRTAECNSSPAAAVQGTIDSVSSQFVASAEYAARATTNSQYVVDLYYALMQRGAEMAGYNYWVGQLNGGILTRGQVRQQFLTSPEMTAQSAAIAAQGCQH